MPTAGPTGLQEDLQSRVEQLPDSDNPLGAFQYHERRLRELPLDGWEPTTLPQADAAERAKDHFRLYQAAADMLQRWFADLYNVAARVE